MRKFLTTLRAALILGKGQKHLEQGRHREALERCLRADQLALEPQFALLRHSIEGKARYRLGDHTQALTALLEAERILEAIVAQRGESTHLRNIGADIRRHIELIREIDGDATANSGNST